MNRKIRLLFSVILIFQFRILVKSEHPVWILKNVTRDADYLASLRNDKRMLRLHVEGEDAPLIQKTNALLEAEAFNTLLDGLIRIIVENEPIGSWVDPQPFKDLSLAIKVHPDLVHLGDGIGGIDKYFLGLKAVQKLGKAHIVYAAGINGEPNFENHMSTVIGSSVFGFDCTDMARENYQFTFYPWCLGQNASFENNIYSQRRGKSDLLTAFPSSIVLLFTRITISIISLLHHTKLVVPNILSDRMQ